VSAIILFMAGIAAIAGWWLSQQRLTAKPWLEEGVIADWREESPSSVPPAKSDWACFSRSSARYSHSSSALTHAHEHGGLAGVARAEAAVVLTRAFWSRAVSRCNGRTWPRAGTT